MAADWREYVICGALNSALPFVCFAFAAQYLPAGCSALLNAMVPMFTVLLAWATSQFPAPASWPGVVLGLLGVGVLARFGAVALSAATLAAFAAGLVAALCYALAALRMRASSATTTPPRWPRARRSGPPSCCCPGSGDVSDQPAEPRRRWVPC